MWAAILVYVLICSLSFGFNAQINSPGATSRFSPGGQYIMLTFSGGPHYYATAKILDILKEKKVKATFFVSGSKAINHESLLKRIHQEKHELASYGFHHQHFIKISQEKVLAGLLESSKLISSVTNIPVKHCRAPNGYTNAEINQYIKTNTQMKVVLWSLDSHDIKEQNPLKIIDNVIKNAKPGDIVLLHDTLNQTITSLPGIIDGLYKQGYEFLTIAEVSSFPDDSPH